MKYLLSFFLFFLFFPFSVHATGAWSYPLSQFSSRSSDKSFGQYFAKQWYVGKTARFPAQFTGYHAALDLEIFPDELTSPAPVFAVADGKIVFAGSVSGYGGLILEQLTGTGATALYGHLKIAPTVKVGESVSSGDQIAVLGDAFSSQTGGERKHLHFGIYKGDDLYFRGYEPTLAALTARWLDPKVYLASHITPTSFPQMSPTSSPIVIESKISSPFFTQLLASALASLTAFFHMIFH